MDKKNMDLMDKNNMDLIADFGEAYVPPQVYTPEQPDYTAEETARWEAEEEFFRPGNQRIVRSFLVDQILPHRYGTPEQPIALEGRSSRLIIAAERLYQERVIHFWNNGEQNVLPQIKEPRGRTKPSYGRKENYRVGDTKITRKQSVYEVLGNTKWERLGFSLTDKVPTWDGIFESLNKITGDDPDQRKALARLLIGFAHNFQPLMSEHLKTTFGLEEEIHELHRIFFHVLITESAAWQSAHYYAGDWRIGMTVTFARSLILLREGQLTLEETFRNNSNYCIYSLKEMYKNCDLARERANNVDKKYKQWFSIDNLTKEHALDDLKEVYGLSYGNDTDQPIAELAEGLKEVRV